MDRRSFIGAAGAVALAGSGMAPVARAQGAPETTRLAFGFGNDPVFAPHMVAMEKGWLRDAGFVDVEFGTALDLAHSGVPIVILGTNAIAATPDKLVARKDANIKAPEDLYRIRIGLLQGSTASADLHFLARHYGLDEKKLQVVNMPPPELMLSVRSLPPALVLLR